MVPIEAAEPMPTDEAELDAKFAELVVSRKPPIQRYYPPRSGYNRGRRNRGFGGQCSPTFGTSGVQGGTGGPMKMILLLQQTVFIQYCTSD